MTTTPNEITISMMREHLYSAVVSDALDGLGFKHQSPRLQLKSFTKPGLLVGRCKTTLWVDMAHVDPKPYDLELKAVRERLERRDEAKTHFARHLEHESRGPWSDLARERLEELRLLGLRVLQHLRVGEDVLDRRLRLGGRLGRGLRVGVERARGPRRRWQRP